MKNIYSLVLLWASISLNAQLISNVDQIVYDHMGYPFRPQGNYPQWTQWGAHEGKLPINQWWDWYDGAVPMIWMDKGTNTAFNATGQIIEIETKSPVTNVRFQIRNHFAYFYTNGQWELAEDVISSIEAQQFKLDYSYENNLDSRNEVNNGGGISYPSKSNAIIHWWRKTWPYNRTKLPNAYDAIFMRCEIRLIPDTDPNVTLDNARYLAAISADYYPLPTSPGESNKIGVTMTRHKILTKEWKIFTAYIAGSTPPANADEYRKEILSRELPPFTILSTNNEEIFIDNDWHILQNDKTHLTIKILTDSKDAKVTVYNTIGHELLHQKIFNTGTQLDIHHLDNGLYIVKLENDSKVKTKIIAIK